MEIWTDNTSIQSAARYLNCIAKGENDISGLLQFSTQLVFCENLYVSAFESEYVANRTKEFWDFTKSLKLNTNDLNIVDTANS